MKVQGSIFYRLSMNKKKATTLGTEEAASVTASLTSSRHKIAPTDAAKNPNLSVVESWKVNDDEYVIRIDASPLHISAAQRLFGGKVQKKKEPASSSPELTAEDVDDFIAMIDDAPLHFSAAQRMFGGAIRTNKVEEEEAREDAEGEVPPNEEKTEERHVDEAGETRLDKEEGAEEQTQNDEVMERAPPNQSVVTEQVSTSASFPFLGTFQGNTSFASFAENISQGVENMTKACKSTIFPERAEEEEGEAKLAPESSPDGKEKEKAAEEREEDSKEKESYANLKEGETHVQDEAPTQEVKETHTRGDAAEEKSAAIQAEAGTRGIEAEGGTATPRPSKVWEEQYQRLGAEWTNFWTHMFHKRKGMGYDLMKSAK